MHAKALRILEGLMHAARAAFKARRLKLLRRVLLKAFILVELDREFRLRSPRFYYLKAHFPLVSYWAHARTLPSGLCNGAYMMFFNFPRFVFNELASLVRPYLPEFDPEVPRRAGRRPLLDYHDLLAIGLRSFRQADQNKLAIDFGMPQPRISEALSVIRPVLARVVREWPAAEVRMLTLQEGEAIWKSMIDQHGMSPAIRMAFKDLVFAYSIDG
jgi:hypothetical protein